MKTYEFYNGHSVLVVDVGDENKMHETLVLIAEGNKALQAKCVALTAERDRLREALCFYADRAHWYDNDASDPANECRAICRSDLTETSPGIFSGGKRARAALEGKG